MGLFRQFKDLRNMVEEAPETVKEARMLQEQARRMQQSGAAGAAGPYSGIPGAGIPQPADIPPGDPRLAEIEGVSLDMYAQVSKVAATRGLNEAGLNAYLASRGIDPVRWARATAGWNARFKGDMQLATQFGRLYQQIQV